MQLDWYDRSVLRFVLEAGLLRQLRAIAPRPFSSV